MYLKARCQYDWSDLNKDGDGDWDCVRMLYLYDTGGGGCEPCEQCNTVIYYYSFRFLLLEAFRPARPAVKILHFSHQTWDYIN